MAKEFVDRILSKLFGEKENPSEEGMPAIKEKLTRSSRFNNQMRAWLSTSRSSELMDFIFAEYERSVQNNGNGLLHLHSTAQANGFFFDSRIGLKKEEFNYLLDHFKDAVLDLGYTLYTSDVKYKEKSDSVQVVERHYLKPSLSKELVFPIDQKYGNVLLEYVAYNGEPAYLKVMATCYSDRSYTKAMEFGALVKLLFDVKS